MSGFQKNSLDFGFVAVINWLGKCILLALSVLLFLVVFEPKIVSAQLEEQRFPYVQTMVISAYYSPVLGQERYATGSYEGDIRLNGSGVNGADGTPVYPGMIAAPRDYPFGFKMSIPGIGTVAVHDRGGAIHGNRLDVWMGYGDEGLKRALNWGKRSVDVEMHGIDNDLSESVYLKGYFEAEKFIRSVVRTTKLLPEDVWYQSQGEDVKKLQEALKKLGYFDSEITGFYGDETLEAVYQFQIDNNIVSSWDDLGAGHCGVQTRTLIEKAVNGQNGDSSPSGLPSPNDVFLAVSIKNGDKGEAVVVLQRELKRLGLLRIAPTGVFDDVTMNAVFKFQQKKGIVSSWDDEGAGVAGPQTRKALNLVFALRENTNQLVAAKKSEMAEAEGSHFLVDLDPGIKSAAVSRLQASLKDLGYFKGEITSYFGEETSSALLAFQLEKNIVTSKSDLGAGRLGPKTRQILNSLL